MKPEASGINTYKQIPCFLQVLSGLDRFSFQPQCRSRTIEQVAPLHTSFVLDRVVLNFKQSVVKDLLVRPTAGSSKASILAPLHIFMQTVIFGVQNLPEVPQDKKSTQQSMNLQLQQNTLGAAKQWLLHPTPHCHNNDAALFVSAVNPVIPRFKGSQADERKGSG